VVIQLVRLHATELHLHTHTNTHTHHNKEEESTLGSCTILTAHSFVYTTDKKNSTVSHMYSYTVDLQFCAKTQYA
jgi:hypothetical protein